jgi:hypothetical protein
MNASGAGAVLDLVELIALPRLLADCYGEGKNTCFTPTTGHLRKMADCTSSAPVTECSGVSGLRPAAPPPITTIQKEDGRQASAP